MHYEGLFDPSEHENRIQKLKLWFLLAKRLGTDLIQIPSNFLPEQQCTGDSEKIVADLREVADCGLQESPVMRFAYEALCWGTHVDVWEGAWEIVQRVDRPNFGTCLDTFNIVGRVWADPASPTGQTPNSEADLRSSLERLGRELGGKDKEGNKRYGWEKIFYIEVVDAERLAAPLIPGHEWYVEDQKPRMSWSRNARLFPFEEGGYLPILKVLEVIVESGWEGYVSFELFNRSMDQAHRTVPIEHAERAARSWGKLVECMRWNGEIEQVEASGLDGVTELHPARGTRIPHRDEWHMGGSSAVARL